jgi:hypothetical protein
MGCGCWNLVNLRDHFGRNAAIHRQQRGLPISGQDGLELPDNVRACIHLGRVIKDGIAEQDDMAHGWYNKKAGISSGLFDTR